MCGGKIYQRTDDSYSVIVKRIEEYKNKTLPVINKLIEKNSLYEIDGDRNVNDVFDDIYKLLKGKVQ